MHHEAHEGHEELIHFYTFHLRAPFDVAQGMLRDLRGEMSLSPLVAALLRCAPRGEKSRTKKLPFTDKIL